MAGGAPPSSVNSKVGPRRLRCRPDFLAAASGRRFHTDRLTAQGRCRTADETRDGEPAEGLYIGLTITKRVGHATERNRIRRRLRDALALATCDALAQPADVVIVARRSCLDTPFATLVEDLCKALGVVTKPRGPKSKSGANAARASASGVHDAQPAHVAGPTGSHDDRADTKTTQAGLRHGTPHGSSDG